MDIKSSATYVSHLVNEVFKIVITSLSLSREGKVSIQAERLLTVYSGQILSTGNFYWLLKGWLLVGKNTFNS